MMQPVYINHIASIHADTASGESLYLSANEPDYKSIITNAALRRRMSRIIKMGVACGLECISTLPSEKVHAIITATGLGCLADTEKFLNTIIENKEQLLNPTPFIQSTFNTIGAQIALLRQIHAYNMTYVHRGVISSIAPTRTFSSPSQILIIPSNSALSKLNPRCTYVML